MVIHDAYILCTNGWTGCGEYRRHGFNWIDLRWPWQNKVINIRDRSKADGLAKGFACVQTTWFLIHSIGRLFQALPFTTLEISIIPLIGCTFLTYFFYWEKPLDLEATTTIMVPAITEDHLAQLRARDPMWYQRPTPEQFKAPRVANEFSTDWYGYKKEKYHTTNLEGLWMSVVGIPFCAFHIAAWDFHFPTYTECILWRVCTMCGRGISFSCSC